MSQEPIILFVGVEILPNIDKRHCIEYLKRYCAIDNLGDTLYIKKLGNNKTTFAIDFEFDEINKVRKIKDEQGNNLEEILFENDIDEYCDDMDECDEVNND